MRPYYEDDLVTIYCGDCLDVMAEMDECSIDTIITDPPYGLEFMGKEWDHGTPGIPFWQEILRVARPGASLLSMGGTRTYHRLVCAIEDAGWEVRDCLMWLYGTGFPKSHDISKAIDKVAGEKREVIGQNPNHRADSGVNYQGIYMGGNTGAPYITAPATTAAQLWNGWGTALKPAWEPIVLATKPRDGTFANNAMKWGVAGLWIDGGRIDYQSEYDKSQATPQGRCTSKEIAAIGAEPDAGRNLERIGFERPEQKGRWPANLILDEEAGRMLDKQVPSSQSRIGKPRSSTVPGDGWGMTHTGAEYDDVGGPSRFFYCAKASKSERTANGATENKHPTVKPLALMQYLCRLTKTPTGGVILDPFMGSGTTLLAAKAEGRKAIGIEMNREYCQIAVARILEAR